MGMNALHQLSPKICFKFSQTLKLKPFLSSKPVLINTGALNDSLKKKD